MHYLNVFFLRICVTLVSKPLTLFVVPETSSGVYHVLLGLGEYSSIWDPKTSEPKRLAVLKLLN